jgi:nucleoid-associated protein YgaU
MRYHTLKQDEDLWFLAEYYYGDAALWDTIYYFNRDTIGDDPENLYPGMKILIPDLEIGNRLLPVIASPNE